MHNILNFPSLEEYKLHKQADKQKNKASQTIRIPSRFKVVENAKCKGGGWGYEVGWEWVWGGGSGCGVVGGVHGWDGRG